MPLITTGHAQTQIRKGGKQLYTFELHHLAGDNERKVWGLASSPDIDREGEVILKSAIEESLIDFMALPIIHLNHTERSIGWFTKAEFRGQDLYVEGRIKPTSDCDQVWDEIEKGTLTQWSIYGDRVKATPSCALDPSMRQEPCVTKALDLYSISLCDKGTAINSRSFAEVLKSVTTIIKAQGLGTAKKATDSASHMIHPTTDGKYPKKGSTMVKPEPEEKKPNFPMKDASNGPSQAEQPSAESAGGVEGAGQGEVGGDTNAVIDLLTQIVERLQSLESSLGLYKSEEKPKTEDPEEEKEEDNIVKCPQGMKKAEVPVLPAPTEISKAELGKIAKAEARITELEAQITTIMKSTPRVPEIVVLDPALNKAMAKDDKGNMQPIEKSAGSSNITGFGRLFK